MERLHLFWVNDQVTFFTRGGEARSDDGWSEIDVNRLKQAIRRIGFRGSSAVLVYEGEYISHHELEVPEMDARLTHDFIRQRLGRQVQAVDPSGHIAFMRAADPRKVLFDVLDSRFYDAVIEAFKACGLAVDIVCGLTPVLAQLARRAPTDAPILIEYADREAGMNFMLYHDPAKKRPAMFRVAPLASNPEHLEQDVRRSIQLGRQLFAGREPEVFLVGEEAFATEQVRLLGDPEALLEAIVALPVQSTSNLVPPGDRGIAVQRLRLWLAVGLLLPFIFGSLAGHVYLKRQMHQYQKTLADIRLLMREREAHVRRIEAVEQKQRFDAAASHHAILPAVLLVQVGNDLSFDFTLRSFTAERLGPPWKDGGDTRFALKGEVQADPVHAPQLLRKLESRFTQAPYHARLIHSWRDDWLKGVQVWSNMHAADASTGIPFEIEAVVHE